MCTEQKMLPCDGWLSGKGKKIQNPSKIRGPSQNQSRKFLWKDSKDQDNTMQRSSRPAGRIQFFHRHYNPFFDPHCLEYTKLARSTIEEATKPICYVKPREVERFFSFPNSQSLADPLFVRFFGLPFFLFLLTNWNVAKEWCEEWNTYNQPVIQV